MRIRIEARDLPGRDSAKHRDVHVAVQRGKAADDVVDPVPADADIATWQFDVTVLDKDGTLDLRGAFVHGRPGARFLYLSWGTIEGETWSMFGRSKLLLSAGVEQDTLKRADDTGTLVGRVGLRDGKGQLRMAAVKPPAIEWTAE